MASHDLQDEAFTHSLQKIQVPPGPASCPLSVLIILAMYRHKCPGPTLQFPHDSYTSQSGFGQETRYTQKG